MNDRDQLIIDLQSQLQKANELNQKSLEYLQRDKEIIDKKESELQTWRKIEQKVSEVDLQEAAKVLKLPYIKNRILGQNLLFDFLRYCHILCISPGSWNQPYQQYLNSYFEMTEVRVEQIEKTITKTLVTQQGLVFIRELYDERGEEWILSRLSEK